MARRGVASLVGLLIVLSSLRGQDTSAVPVAVALDAPDRVWRATAAPNGLEVRGESGHAWALGGHLVWLPSGATLATDFSGPGLVRMAYQWQWPAAWDGDTMLPAERMLQAAAVESPWSISVWSIPSGVSTVVWRHDQSWESGLDAFEFIPEPATLAEALGVPADRLTTGGAGAWEKQAVLPLGAFAAVPHLTADAREAWLRLAVTGPAEVHFTWLGTEWRLVGRLLCDDIPLRDDFYSYLPEEYVIEVPAGEHQLIWEIALSADVELPDPLDLGVMALADLRVRPLAPPGRVLPALGVAGPVVTSWPWQPATAPAPFGPVALHPQLPPWAPPASSSSTQLGMGVVGPGRWRFDWGLMPDTPSGQWQASLSGDPLHWFSSSEATAWAANDVLVPPGPQTLEVAYYGSPEYASRAGLGKMSFEPYPQVSLGEALDAPELPWISDPTRPWSGYQYNTPTGDAVLSPTLGRFGSTWLKTTVPGPGQLSFRKRGPATSSTLAEVWLDGVPVLDLSYWPDDDPVILRLPERRPVEVTWRFFSDDSRPSSNTLELDEVTWAPWPDTSLGDALDTPASVTWTTAESHPFLGQPVEDTLGGTAAGVVLPPGGETWLEATVEGPGWFDFWVFDLPGFSLGWNLWQHLEVTVDGQRVPLSGWEWPSLLVTGEGPHRLRFTVRNPLPEHPWQTSETIALAIDEVTWRPLGATTLATVTGGGVWTASETGVIPLASGGPQNQPMLGLALDGTSRAWLETTVTGPATIRWAQRGTSYLCTVRIDDQIVLPAAHEAGWHMARLSVPSGTHVLRWVPRETGDEVVPVPPVFVDGVVWFLSDFQITPGVSELAEAVDETDGVLLELGVTGGRRLTGLPEAVNGDAWEFGPGSTIVAAPLHPAARLTVRWGGREETAFLIFGIWPFGFGFPSSQNMSAAPGWEVIDRATLPQNIWRWHAPALEPVAPLPRLDALTYLPAPPVIPLAEAMDVAGSVTTTTGGWAGVADPARSHDGTDAAHSLLTEPGMPHAATWQVEGPCLLRGWWRRQGVGRLTLRLDGALVPLPPATTEWAEVSLRVGAGSHQIEFRHESTERYFTSAFAINRPEAWLDAWSAQPVADFTLPLAAATPSLTFSTEPVEGRQWAPLALGETLPTAESGAWCSGSSAVLRATVTGPGVLRFRSRCYFADGTPPPTPPPDLPDLPDPPDQGSGGGGVVITFPEDRPVITPILTCSIGDSLRLTQPAQRHADWEEASLAIPSGTHEVTWRLLTHHESYGWGTHSDIVAAGIHGWVREVWVQPRADHYTEWQALHQLAPGTMDGDGDGVPDSEEYFFGTDPNSSQSRPDALRLYFDQRLLFEAPAWRLSLPPLPPWSEGIVETSADLQTWTPFLSPAPFAPLAYAPFVEGLHWFPVVRGIPVPTPEAPTFYRVRSAE